MSRPKVLTEDEREKRRKEYLRKYYQKNRERLKKYQREYRQENKDQVRRWSDSYYVRHRDRVLLQQSSYRTKKRLKKKKTSLKVQLKMGLISQEEFKERSALTRKRTKKKRLHRRK